MVKKHKKHLIDRRRPFSFKLLLACFMAVSFSAAAGADHAPIEVTVPETAAPGHPLTVGLALSGVASTSGADVNLTVRLFPDTADSVSRPKTLYQARHVFKAGGRTDMEIPGHVFKAPGRYLITAVSDSLFRAGYAEVRVPGLSLRIEAPETLRVGETAMIAAELHNSLDRAVDINRFAFELPGAVAASGPVQDNRRQIGANKTLRFALGVRAKAPGLHPIAAAVGSDFGDIRRETHLFAVRPPGNTFQPPAVAADAQAPDPSPAASIPAKPAVPSPAEVDALIARGKDAALNQDYDRAIQIFNRVLAHQPDCVIALYERSRALFKTQNEKSALADLNRVLEIDPDYTDALCARSSYFINTGNYQRAAADAERAIQVGPADACGYAERGRMRLNLGLAEKKDGSARKTHLDQAIADFRQAVRKKHPHPERLHNNIGVAYGSMPDYEKAVAAYSQAIAIKPDTPLYYSNRGFCYRKTNRLQKALRDYNRALALDPKRPRDDAQRAYVNRLLKHYNEAIDGFTRAVKGGVKEDWVFAGRGYCHLQKKAYSDAVRDFSAAIEKNQRYEWVFANRGQAYLKLGDIGNALADFNRAVALDPKDAWNVAHRGEAYRRSGKREEAIRDFKKAVALDPAYTWARNRLKAVQSDTLVETAVDTLEKIITRELRQKQ